MIFLHQVCLSRKEISRHDSKNVVKEAALLLQVLILVDGVSYGVPKFLEKLRFMLGYWYRKCLVVGNELQWRKIKFGVRRPWAILL